jgi:hypothetical protein
VVMEAVFNAVAQGKYQCFTQSVDPKSVKAHFGTGKGDHDKNKLAAIDYCKIVLGWDEEYCRTNGIDLNSHKADAVLQLIYYAKHQLSLWLGGGIFTPTIKFVDSNEIANLQ